MSNKTSDKNVANIEDDVNELKRLLYSDILTQYGKRKLVNYYEQRIQELEEENRIFALEGSKVRLELYIKENYIPKQAVIDKMEELNKEIKNSDEIDAIFKIKQQQVLQELLETK